MMLSDRCIEKRLVGGSLIIEPMPQNIQPASVDLHVAESVGLDPKAFALGSTVEYFEVPIDLGAQVDGRSTWGRRGLMVHVTAGYIDPGFRGQITLELHNVSDRFLQIDAGTRLAQIRFFQLSSPALRPYGSLGLGSHYQDSRGTIGPAKE